jgi:hypothetical protein
MDKQSITLIDSNEFDRVWKIFTEIGVLERHFNELESRYRSLASSWLLATFVGIGFVVAQPTIELPIERLLVVTIIAVAGTIGITLLWNADLMVYHKLLDAAFIEGLNIEHTYTWLPQIRRNMMKLMDERGVLPRVVWFYIGANTVLLLLAGGSLTILLARYGVLATIFGIIITASCIWALAYYVRDRTLHQDAFQKSPR